MAKPRKALRYRYLVPMALLLGLAPVRPEPHLIEKLGMLVHGTLSRPIDILDLVLHGTLPAVLLIRLGGDLWEQTRRRRSQTVWTPTRRSE